jgi:hypothetical protein
MRPAAFISGAMIAWLASATSAFASCAFLGESNAGFVSDKQVFVRNGGGNWIPFTSVQSLNLAKRTAADFAVAIVPLSGRDRSGIVVIKSNRVERIGDKADVTRNVRLLRNGVQPEKLCVNHRRYDALPDYDKSVSTAAYMDFHDYRAKDTAALRSEEVTLTKFHFVYYSPVKGRCITTDDDNADESPEINTSNRSQFSYDATVLRNGRYGSEKLWARLPSPFDGYADHKTLVKRYTTDNGVACVEFKLEVDPDEYVLRINDLEGREKAPSNRRQPERRIPP